PLPGRREVDGAGGGSGEVIRPIERVTTDVGLDGLDRLAAANADQLGGGLVVTGDEQFPRPQGEDGAGAAALFMPQLRDLYAVPGVDPPGPVLDEVKLAVGVTRPFRE